MIKIDYSRLTGIKDVRQQKKQLEAEEKYLSQALLTDIKLIPQLFDWCVEICRRVIWQKESDSRRFRKQFLFLMVYLYAPERLAGAKLPYGLRKMLADLLGYRSASGISNQCSNMIFQYKNYKDFRREINIIYNLLLDKLRKEGKIK